MITVECSRQDADIVPAKMVFVRNIQSSKVPSVRTFVCFLRESNLCNPLRGIDLAGALARPARIVTTSWVELDGADSSSTWVMVECPRRLAFW